MDFFSFQFIVSDLNQLIQRSLYQILNNKYINIKLFMIIQNLIASAIMAQSIYNLYKHPAESPAKCLDGSPAALYISIGQNSNSNNILLFFQGGEFCGGTTLTSTLQDCYQRSKTDLGSSLEYQQTVDFQNRGILSSNQNNNPVFYDWTKIFIPYCDGTAHQGSRLNPISYKDAQLYFRGSNNTIQHLKYLNQTLGLFSASRIVVTGVSAGGVSTYIWSNYIYQRSINKNVLSIADSGIFIFQYVDPFTGRQVLVDKAIEVIKLANNQTSMPLQQCAKELGQVLCFSAGNIVKYLKNPFFVIQSQYDLYCVSTILTLDCVPMINPSSMQKCNDTQKAAIQDYRTAALQVLNKFKQRNNGGIWSPACFYHSFIHNKAYNNNSYTIPTTTGIKVSSAIQQFLDNPNSKNNVFIDEVAWPNNIGCSGINNFS